MARTALTKSDTSLAGAPGKQRNAKAMQILEGARSAFLELGFEGTSTDEIVRRAGVSKATLYNHFSDKQAMFAAVLQDECERQAKEIFTIEATDKNVRKTLLSVAKAYLRFLTSVNAIRMVRVLVAEAERFPDLSHAFWTSGPELGIARLSAYFDRLVDQGRLHIGDTVQAAHEFTELCRSDLFYRRLLGVKTRVTQKDIDAYSERAVGTFLQIYTEKGR